MKKFQVDTGGTLTTGLVAYYKLEDTTDFWGTNNLTGVSNPSFQSGKVNNGVSLDGSTNYLTTASTITPVTNFSISVWVKKAGTTASQAVMGQEVTVGYIFDFETNVNDWLIFVGAGTGTEQVSFAGGPKTDWTGIWRHLVLTKSGTTIELFIDGVSKGTQTLSQLASITEVGRGQSNKWGGMIDELGIWNKVLSATEIADLYNGGAGQTMIEAVGGVARRGLIMSM
jgi:hypothetical protein